MTTAVNDGTVRHRIGRDGSFALRTTTGSVRLRGTDGEEVEVKATLAGGEPAAITVRRYEAGLHVEPERQSRSFLGGTIGLGLPDIHFEVSLPNTARVEVNSVSASVSGSQLYGDSSYKLVSGDLQLTDIGGRLDAKSVSGDLSLRTGRTLEVEAVTTSGDVHVEAAQIEVLRLRSVSGDATVVGALSAGPEHRVETVSGDLRLEPQGGLTVEASGPIVGLRSDIAGRAAGGRGRRNLVIGDGSAQLRFRSLSGQVHVAQPGTAPPQPSVETVPPPEPMSDSLEILRALERGEIDVDDATRLLSRQEENHA
ncbi:MAG TPA: DUF4097 family beta strand repeat-containing protein [Candidatus Limnocylindria bacterium]|nr:DUF4097 family beta strand repeat-containing protein [Candidatus Limnocylindria bacterium]